MLFLKRILLLFLIFIISFSLCNTLTPRVSIHRYLGEAEEENGNDLINITKNGPLGEKLAYYSNIYKKGTHMVQLI